MHWTARFIRFTHEAHSHSPHALHPGRLLLRMVRHLIFLSTEGVRVIALVVLLSTASLAVADPALEEARSLGDALFEQGVYQRAGECYEAAGEYALANQAFLEAVGPESAAARHRVSEQGEQAKALLRKVEKAFR
jgi:hypothetical protein